MNLEISAPLIQIPVEIKNTVVRVAIMLSPDFIMLWLYILEVGSSNTHNQYQIQS